MISLGSNNIKGLRLGTSKINKVYLGDKLIWTISNPKIFEGNYRYDIDLTESDYFKPNTSYKFTVSDSEEYNFFYWIDGKSQSQSFKSEITFDTVNCTKIAVVNKSFRQFILTVEKADLGDSLVIDESDGEKKIFSTQLKFYKRESEKDLYIYEYPENYENIEIEFILIGDEYRLTKEDIVSWTGTIITVSDNSSVRNAVIDKGTKVVISYN